MDLKEILNRRSDLSTFLVHLTRDSDRFTARENLESILVDRRIEARSVYGMLTDREKDVPKGVWESLRCVCFTETPLEYCHLIVQEIEGRRFRFGPYGIAITKRGGRKLGVNPVWYLDITPGHDWLTENVNALIKGFVADGCKDQNLPALLPFMEQMGTGHRRADGERYVKEFWWEREWRKVGSLDLDATSFICLCPEEEIEHFETVLAATAHEATCVDPRWSLEKIIAKLAGFSSDEIDVA